MTTFTKLIEMQFARDGARTRFVGFVGELRDESNVLIHSALYDTKPAAERTLDALVHDLLIDYAERGLVDTLPACDPPAEPSPLGGEEGDELPRCANCAGAACWEVPFANAPHYCAACLPAFLRAEPIDLCDFCGKPSHFGACPELIAFTERVKAKVFAHIANPHPCPNCGDLTAADVCPACQEWGVDPYGISLELRRRISIDAAERVAGLPF